jgi:hypothetical protein
MNYRPLRSHLPKVLKPKLNSIFDEGHGGSKRKRITGLFIILMIFCLLIGAFYALGGFSNPITKLTKGDRERVLDRVPLDPVPPSL